MYFYSLFRNQPKSFIRILHASPDAPGVDVYLNNRLIAKNLTYKNFTQYLSLLPGLYNIRIYPTGKLTNPLISTNFNIPPNTITTIAVADRLSNLTLIPFLEPKLPKIPGKAYIRFVHLSPNTPAVDITLPNGTVLFKDISFKKATDYIPVSSGKYTIEARPTGTSNIILTVPNINLKPERFYTIYAVGLYNGNPPLQVLIPLDGNSYIEL